MFGLCFMFNNKFVNKPPNSLSVLTKKKIPGLRFRTSISLLGNHLLFFLCARHCVGHWKFTNNLATNLSFREPQSRLCIYCCQMWAHVLDHMKYMVKISRNLHSQRDFWEGYTHLFSLYFMCIWYFYIFISLYFLIVRDSLLEEFTNGKNIYFNNSCQNSALIIQKVVFFYPLQVFT